MKRKILLRQMLGTAAMLIVLQSGSFGQSGTVHPAEFVIHRGVNLSHWLSQNFGWSPKATFITEHDIRFIDSIGYDHVRIPIDEAELWDTAGKPIEESFTYLTRCLDWCGTYHLRAIVDLHILRSHHFNAANEGTSNALWTDEKAQETFIRLWMNLSGRLKQYPDSMVAYELLNEPVAENPEDWNVLIAKCTKALRALEPQRVFIIGSNRWQTPSSFPFLKIPANDPNIILSMHTYSPLFFTHHLASWTSFKGYKGPVHYPGQVVSPADYRAWIASDSNATRRIRDTSAARFLETSQDVWNRQRIVEELTPAVQRARELGLQLYCGEFGCLPHVDRKERLAYYRDIVSVFAEQGTAYCNWEYKGDFGIYQFDFSANRSGAPDTELIQILIQK